MRELNQSEQKQVSGGNSSSAYESDEKYNEPNENQIDFDLWRRRDNDPDRPKLPDPVRAL